MFAARPERPINFGPPSFVPDRPQPAQKSSDAEQTDLMMQLMEVIMKAVNGKTDAGLMQVNADTFAQLKKENPALLGNADISNPRDNIMAGALYLRDQTQAFGGDIGAGLRAYNSGPDKVNRNDLADTGGVGDPGYPANVLKFAEIIASGKGQLPG